MNLCIEKVKKYNIIRDRQNIFKYLLFLHPRYVGFSAFFHMHLNPVSLKEEKLSPMSEVR